MIVVLIYFLSQVKSVKAQETFQFASILLDNTQVSQITTLNYQIQLRRDANVNFGNNDYINITIPSDDVTTAHWNKTYVNLDNCNTSSGAKVKNCRIKDQTDNKVAIIKIGGQANLILQGSIYGFQNPVSIKGVENIIIGLYNNKDQLKAQSVDISFNQFVSSSLTAQLSSSSTVIGQKQAVLTVVVNPSTELSPKGKFQLYLPNYYEGAKQDFMISTRQPKPCQISVGTVLSCQFQSLTQTLTIEYQTNDSLPIWNSLNFTVGNFNNPLSKTKSGFKLSVIDDDDYLISQSLQEFTLSGIVDPINFTDTDFNYVDFSNAGQLAIHQFVIQSSIPLLQNCLFRIIYPPEMQVTNQLLQIQGTGFFEPLGGVVSFIADNDNNIVTVNACQKNFGQTTSGILTLSKVRNQAWKRDLSTFKVLMAYETDDQFEAPFQVKLSDFKVLKDQQLAGYMTGRIKGSQTLVQTFSSLLIYVKPSISLNTSAYIQILIPNSLQFNGPSCTISESKGFSKLINCNRDQQLVTIRNLFDQYYDASIGTELYMRVEDFTLPLSVQPIGMVYLTTWDYREKKMNIIDEINLDNMTLTAGKIAKMSEVNVNTKKTSLINQIYTFHFKISHRIEKGGFFRIFLSQDEKNGVQISDYTMVSQNCFLVQSGSNSGVPCYAGVTDDEPPLPYVNLNCSQVNFGDEGAQKDSEVKFQIKGLTNPRLINYESYFQIYTTDELMYPIDQSFDDQKFSVVMTEMAEIDTVNIKMVSLKNGDFTDYYIKIIPVTQVWTDDAFQIVFPPEISFPEKCNCRSTDNYITSIDCVFSGVNKIIFHFIEIQSNHKALQPLSFTISNIKNPISQRTTSDFTEIILFDFTNSDYLFQKYNQPVNVTTNLNGQIDRKSVIYNQSSYNTKVISTNSIKFQTNSPLPKDTAIILSIPKVFEQIYLDDCQIKLDGREIKQNEELNITCVLEQQQGQLIFLNFFSSVESFSGSVELIFKLQNPELNTKTITESPYQIEIFDDSSFQYGIDDLKGWPIPSLGCAYPCNTCFTDNIEYCTSCIQSEDAPQFLHIPKGSQVQTCVKHCPKEDGFTSNGSKNPKKCVKCGDTCQECAQNDNPGDINICTKCKPTFNYFWSNQGLCFGNQCPDGTFQNDDQANEDGQFECLTCFQPCKSCTNRQVCTKCNAGGKWPYLQRETCVEQCAFGSTPYGGNCTRCRPPCGTCENNSPDSCKSCNDPIKQYLYGHACMANCPNGTYKNVQLMRCQGCLTGCQVCDPGDPSICLICQPGLSKLNNTCRSECPFEYKKSSDGTTCELRTYPLDANFIAFPFIIVALFFTMITLASFWLTGKRSLVSSTLIAFYGPIEMAASLYQALYSAQANTNYRPILIGSSFAFAAGIIVNITFFGVYQKQIKGKDKLFERWRKQKWCIANFYLWIATFFSVNVYRLIFCQLFRLEMMSVKVSRPQPFLRPLLIFGFIKFLVFNLPLLITNFLGIGILEWGNQCHMTMLESTILSFLTLLLMIWEYFQKENLIVRENIQLSMKNLENIDEAVHLKNEDEDGGKFSSLGGNRKKKITPGYDDNFLGQTSSGLLLSRQDRGAISLNNIKFQLQNNVTMTELKDAEGRRQPSSRAMTRRIDFFHNIVNLVKQNIGMLCNGDIDDLLNAQIDEKKKSILRRNHSMKDMNTHFWFKKPINEAAEEEQVYELMDQEDALEKANPNIYKDKNEEEIQQIKDNLEVRPRRYSFPNCELFVDHDEKMKQFLEYMESIRQLAIDQNTRGNQYVDPIDDNVYASARDPPPVIIVTEVEVQTVQEKDNRGDNEEFQNRAKDQAREALNEQIFENLMADQNKKKSQKKRKKGFRGGKGSSYKLVLGEDEEQSEEKSDKESQAAIPTDLNVQNFQPVNSRYAMKVPENHQSSGVNMLTLAMQVEQNYSTTGLYDLYQAEEERKMKLGLVQEDTDFLNPVFSGQSQFSPAQGINLSRVSGDLDFSEGEEEEAQKAAEQKKIENVQAWIQDETEGVNQRTFNENDIVGNFERDWSGAIVDREYTLKQMKYRDSDGNLVNNRGYLIDEITGDIRSKYTFELVFKSYDLIGIGKKKVELPLPFRLERHNFNPHQCMGNFDYSILDEPIILKDQYGNRIDKNFRRVNKMGWLVDEIGNVVDNQGRARFLVQQLQENGEIPNLFNYEGYEYSMRSIIGIFEKNTKSKEIILCKTKQNKNSLKTYSCDLRYRRVNPKGYLLDERGNIIDNKNNIIWHQHQLMFNEPQKIFSFSEFSMNWVRGTLDRDVTLNQKHDDEYDLNGNKINTMGYLIDDYDNVVDVFSQSILFKNETLKGMYGMESEIPKIFREGKLKRPPDDDPIETLLQKTHDRARKGKHKVVAPGGFNLDQDKKDSSTDEDPFDITEYNYNENEAGKINLQKLQKAQKGKYGKQKDGQLAGLLTPDGKEIDSIDINSHQQMLVGNSRFSQFEEDKSEESKKIRPKTGKAQNQGGNVPGVAGRQSSAIDKRQSKIK